MPIYRPLEDLTATLLQRLLGRYITGLEGRNLRVAVWSGRVVLENLTLRPDALVGLLPVGVRAGFVGRIEMSVPWHKLGSSPVTLELHDVFMLAMPLNEAGIAPAQASNPAPASTRAQIPAPATAAAASPAAAAALASASAPAIAGWTTEEASSFHWVRKQAKLRVQERR
jgi:hypothetical protein